ncbi:hypothetical protein BKH46_01910 [Helicobacter sp. 12S02634-8]|uniref:hypothetical protein n=1 Tax=Helicobacter sp. 12S02634-8 TaxID=1476199 RepID=UPI000BA7314B|nr:hypothetical protein [Helicobacter sp. 12S02634-8]PAF48090.1 hypothetical protein BKH46_01910 [Helicobacter sp. 12S02634-8]
MAEFLYHKFTPIQKLLILWQTRSLGSKIDTLMLLFPVLVYLGRPDLDAQLKRAKALIDKMIKPNNLALKIFSRVMMRVGEYAKDEKTYMQDRDRAFDAVVGDIQLYAIVLDMLGDKGYETQRDILRSVIQKAYDEAYHISKENKRILEYQEQAFR